MPTKRLTPKEMDAVAADVFGGMGPADWGAAADWGFAAKVRMAVVFAGRRRGHDWFATPDFNGVLARLQDAAMRAIDARDGLVNGNDPTEPADYDADTPL